MPRDAAPRPDHRARPDARRTKEINWTAVSALAGTAAALIALMAYAVPHGAAPNPAPTLVPTSSNSSPAPAASTPPPSSASSGPAQPTGVSAVCQQEEATIGTYRRTVRSSLYSEVNAASRAGEATENELQALYTSGGSNTGPGSTIYLDLSTLANDFESLYEDAMEEVTGAYNAVAATTNADIQTFESDCS